MKILNCILDNRFGGPHRRSQAIARELRNYNIETVFLFGQKEKGPPPINGFDCFLMKNLQLFRRKNPILNLLKSLCFFPYNILKIRKIIKANNIDIVHVDGVTNIVPALAASVNATPIVCHLNDNVPDWEKKMFLPLITILADRIITQGEKLKAQYFRNNSKSWHKTDVVYPAVDIRTFTPNMTNPSAKQRLKEEFEIPPDCLVIGTIGNIHPNKGFDFFIRSAQEVKAQLENVKFLIVGRKLDTADSYFRKLNKIVSELGLENDVIFTGFRKDIPEILSGLDVFVLSSVVEVCPNTILEAMAMKVPVVATDVGAVSEQIIDGQTGIIVEPRNADAIAQAVLQYIEKPRREIEKMLDEARKTIEEKFSLDRISKQQRKIYESVLNNGISGNSKRCNI